MQQIRPIRHTMLGASFALGFAVFAVACSPASPEPSGPSGTGGSAGPGTGGTAPGTGGGSAPGTGGNAPGTGGGTPGTGGGSAPGTGGSAPGTGGSAPGTGGSAPGTGGAASPDAGSEAGAPDAASATPTFTRVFTEILNPGCTGPGNACHSVVRDGYFHFAMQNRAYELLVPMPARVGTIPARVMVLINYVTPKNANDPNSVQMPPQSGPNLGNPPTRKPPLTAAQVALIRAWALAGAKND